MFEQNVFQGPGTGTFTTHTFEILFMLGVTFLLGLWLGWVLWSRYRQEAERLRIENVSLDATATTLRTEQDALKAKMAEVESSNSSLESQVQSLNWDGENLRNQLTVLESDLYKVQERNRQLESELGLAQHPSGNEEIGNALEMTAPPVPSKPLDDNLPDLEAVADAPEGQEIAGTVHLEASTPTLESETELADLDDTLDASTVSVPTPVFIAPVPEEVSPTTDASDTTKKKKPAAKDQEETPIVVAVNKGPRDDLKIVEGIGPKIEELLFNAGVTTYGQLSATSVQQLKNILADAGPRFSMHDPGTWPAQSLLAANGEWAELKSYQEFLHGGKRPDK